MEESVLYRLVITRALLDQARVNSTRQDPTSLAIAVLNLHDALDNLIGAVATHLDLAIPEQATLLKTYDRVAQAQRLPTRVRLEQLNALRNTVKHHGLHPNPAIVRLMVPDLVKFADQVSQQTLGVQASSVRTTDLIADSIVKGEMEQIAKKVDAGEYKNALDNMAFVIFRFYELPKLFQARIANLRRLPPAAMPRPSHVAEYPNIDETELRLDLIELGIDPREYEQFHLIVPQVGLVPGASDTAYVSTRNRYTWHEANWTRENCDRAYEFLMRLILAEQARAPRLSIQFEASLDVVTFTSASALYTDAAGEIISRSVNAGDQFYVQNLPFVDGRWQGWGGERAQGLFHIDGEWISGYIDKQHVKVAKYTGENREA